MTLSIYESIESLVRIVHPDHPWDTEKFGVMNSKNAPQIYMERVVRSLFPNSEIRANVRTTLRVRGDRKSPLEIDVYLPDLKLGFEYQVSPPPPFPLAPLFPSLTLPPFPLFPLPFSTLPSLFLLFSRYKLFTMICF